MGATAKNKKTQPVARTAAKKKQPVVRTAARKKRVKRLKKIIIGTVLSAIVIPIVVCVIFAIQISSLKRQLQEAQATCDALMETMANGSFHLGEDDFLEESVSEETDVEETVASKEPVALEEQVEEPRTRKVYLTFDDGPSDNTLAILEVLDQYDVKATFFVTGEEALTHPERYQAIVDGGHTLGMHSYSHKYSEIYASLDNFGSDLLSLQEYIEETTQTTPKFYRFPGGSSNTVSEEPMSVFCDYLTDNEITYFDWNISSRDATNPMRSADEIIYNCTVQLENFNTAVILLHDASNKSSTVEALPGVIEAIQAMENTEILPITEETVVIHHKK